MTGNTRRETVVAVKEDHEGGGTLRRPLHDSLLSRIESAEVRVGIIGLGYVGLPLARAFCDRGIAVLGFDVDPVKIERLQRGDSYIKHITATTVRQMLERRFEATVDFRRLDEPDIIIICVPTPLTDTREPDLTYVISSARVIAERLRPGQLVVLESTTYPGTTRDVVLPILAAKGLKPGAEFFLAYSPEREDPGNPQFSAPTIPKVVGGLDPASLELAAALYGKVVVRVVSVSSPEVAEACKILENTYRAINIALVNELKVIYTRMGIDVWEVIEAAKSKPFGFQAFYPGPGLGGHCLAGSETVRIQGASFDATLTLSDLFDQLGAEIGSIRIGDVEVVDCTDLDLKTLSIEPETATTTWKPVSQVFRRRFEGTMIEIQLAGNHRLRVTDRHPMLVVEDDRLTVRPAKDIQPGDSLPQLGRPNASEDSELNDPCVDLLTTLPDWPINRLQFNSGEVGYVSSSPGRLGQTVDLLLGRGPHRTREQGIRSICMAGRMNPRSQADPPGGTQASQRGRLANARLRPLSLRSEDDRSERNVLEVREVTPMVSVEMVYSLEVPGNHTFATTGGIFVHNCIPIDPFYLTWVARKHGLSTRFIELAGEINTSMPAYVVSKVADALNDRCRSIKGSKITLLGMAYKKDVDDPRESPGFELMELLLNKGAVVEYNDPYIATLPSMRHYPDLRMSSQELTEDYLRTRDCLLIVTDHSAYDWNWIAQHAPLIVDTRNATKNVIAPVAAIVRA